MGAVYRPTFIKKEGSKERNGNILAVTSGIVLAIYAFADTIGVVDGGVDDQTIFTSRTVVGVFIKREIGPIHCLSRPTGGANVIAAGILYLELHSSNNS